MSADRVFARGAFWVAAGQALNVGARLAVAIATARVLSPRDFGVMGLALLAVATLQALSETGVERAFVQRPDAAGYVDVAWSLLLGRALLLALVLLALCKPLAWFYDEPRLAGMLAVMSLTVALGGLRNLSTGLLHRALAFRKLFVLDLARAVAHLGAGLALVLTLRSAWALVATQLITMLVDVVSSYVVHSHRPRLELDREKALELLRYGRWLTGMAVLALLVTRGDDMFVGKYLGAAALGLYTFAFEIANVPATQITHVLGRASFPIYARLHAAGDAEGLSRAFSRVVRSTLLLSVACSVFIAFYIEPVVDHVLGAKWRPGIALVRLLVAAGFLRSCVALVTALFHAVGRPDLDLRMNLPRLATLAVLIWPACRAWGLEGAAWLVLLAVGACLPTWFSGVRQYTGRGPRELAREATPALVLLCTLTLTFGAARAAVSAATPLGAVLQLMAALALSLLALWAIDRATPVRLLHELRDAVRPR